MEKLKVLVADDSVVSRNMISNAVESTNLARVEHSTASADLAVEWLKQCKIDVLLIDAYMFEKENYKILNILRNEFPHVDIIIMSKEEQNSAAITLKALQNGAIDFILKPPETDPVVGRNVVRNQLQVLFAQVKVRKYSSQINNQTSYEAWGISDIKAHSPVKGRIPTVAEIPKDIDLVVIAASTGGPVALETIFGNFSSSLQKPVLVVQHMPAEFTRILAQTLDKKSSLRVAEGRADDEIKGKQAIIAPGGMHMTVDSTGPGAKIIRLEQTPYVNGVRPAADVLFHSVAEVYESKNILAVILTGMGSDGTKGVQELKNKCNCYCITQSEKTCVVYGMPRCVYEAGLSDEEVDLKDIAGRICQIASTGR